MSSTCWRCIWDRTDTWSFPPPLSLQVVDLALADLVNLPLDLLAELAVQVVLIFCSFHELFVPAWPDISLQAIL